MEQTPTTPTPNEDLPNFVTGFDSSRPVVTDETASTNTLAGLPVEKAFSREFREHPPLKVSRNPVRIAQVFDTLPPISDEERHATAPPFEGDNQ